jgi:hypothetical protein
VGQHFDAIVVGRELAGVVAASLLAKRGWRVLLALEPAPPPRGWLPARVASAAVRTVEEALNVDLTPDADPMCYQVLHGRHRLEIPRTGLVAQLLQALPQHVRDIARLGRDHSRNWILDLPQESLLHAALAAPNPFFHQSRRPSVWGVRTALTGVSRAQPEAALLACAARSGVQVESSEAPGLLLCKRHQVVALRFRDRTHTAGLFIDSLATGASRWVADASARATLNAEELYIQEAWRKTTFRLSREGVPVGLAHTAFLTEAPVLRLRVLPVPKEPLLDLEVLGADPDPAPRVAAVIPFFRDFLRTTRQEDWLDVRISKQRRLHTSFRNLWRAAWDNAPERGQEGQLATGLMVAERLSELLARAA